MRLCGPYRAVLFLAFGLGFVRCGSPQLDDPSSTANPAENTKGTLVFFLSDSVEARIPAMKSAQEMTLYNGAETLVLTAEDSGCFRVPVFDGTLCLGPQGAGAWTDVLRTGEPPYVVDLKWVDSDERMSDNDTWGQTEYWRMAFGLENPWFGDLVLQRSAAGRIKGTIETATGDFRYLHGSVEGFNLNLQTFDGAHLFHFKANTSIADSLVDGVFSSGNHYTTQFIAHRKSDKDPLLASGNEAVWTGLPVAYSGKDLLGQPTEWTWSPSDSAVHVLSVMGSWCPNCMDEHRLLIALMEEHPNMYVHTLAFERGLNRDNGETAALKRLKQYSRSLELQRFEDRWSISLIGPASKKEAQSLLPFLDRVVSFPTSIVMTPGALQPWIHTGFNGPATGQKYALERSRFSAAISGLTESR